MLETSMLLVDSWCEFFAVLAAAAIATRHWYSQHCSTRHKSPRWSLCHWHCHECNCFVCPNVDGYFNVTDGKEGWTCGRNCLYMELWFFCGNLQLWDCSNFSDSAHVMQFVFVIWSYCDRLLSYHLSVMLCIITKWYIQQQKFLNKWIGSGYAILQLSTLSTILCPQIPHILHCWCYYHLANQLKTYLALCYFLLHFVHDFLVIKQTQCNCISQD